MTFVVTFIASCNLIDCVSIIRVMCFSIAMINLSTQVVLVHLGVTSVIAHIKVGQMHAALESKVLVVSAQGEYYSILYIKNVSKYIF